jgi:hypothetical protein
MRHLSTLPLREQATLCYKNNCTTVYGETAKIVNAIVLTVVIVSAISLLAKALK